MREAQTSGFPPSARSSSRDSRGGAKLLSAAKAGKKSGDFHGHCATLGKSAELDRRSLRGAGGAQVGAYTVLGPPLGWFANI